MGLGSRERVRDRGGVGAESGLRFGLEPNCGVAAPLERCFAVFGSGGSLPSASRDHPASPLRSMGEKG